MAEYTIRQYDSIHAFLKVASQGDKTGASHASRDAYGEHWHGTESHAEAVQFAKYGGWNPENIVSLRNSFEELIPKLRQFVEFDAQRHINTSGDEVNVAMYLAGEPEHMLEWVPSEDQVSRRALCLLVGHSISAGCSARALFIRGQAVIALLRALALLGYELEVWSEETVDNSYSNLVRLHAAGSVMDESAVEFAIGNPAWLRRLLFAAEEMEPMDIRKRHGFVSNGGYGSPSGIQHADLVGADLQIDLGRTWFGEGYDGEKSDAELAKLGIEWVAAQLKALGVLDEDAELEWD